MVPLSRDRKLGRLNKVRLVTKPPYSFADVKDENFQAGLAWGHGDGESMSEVITVGNHGHLGKKGYSFLDGNHVLYELTLRFLEPLSDSPGKGPPSVLKEVYGDILPAKENGAEDCARTVKQQRRSTQRSSAGSS